MQHPKTDDKRLPMADKEHHPKSLLNRYGTILRWIKEICNQGDSFAWDKPQADHQKKSQKATTKRQVLQNQYFVGLFLLPFGDLDRQKEGIDGQKLVPNSYPRQDFQKRGTICRKLAERCRDLATLHLSHYELIKVVL